MFSSIHSFLAIALHSAFLIAVPVVIAVELHMVAASHRHNYFLGKSIFRWRKHIFLRQMNTDKRKYR